MTVRFSQCFLQELPDTVLKPSEKHILAAALADKADDDARRCFSAPGPELWAGRLKELLKPAGILLFQSCWCLLHTIPMLSLLMTMLDLLSASVVA